MTLLPKLPGPATYQEHRLTTGLPDRAGPNQHHEHQLGPFFPSCQGQPCITSISGELACLKGQGQRASRASAGTLLPKLPGPATHHEHQRGTGVPRKGKANEHREHQLGPFFPSCQGQPRITSISGELACPKGQRPTSIASISWNPSSRAARASKGTGLPPDRPTSIMSVSCDPSSQAARASHASGASAGNWLA